jgi:hypothetical protein
VEGSPSRARGGRGFRPRVGTAKRLWFTDFLVNATQNSYNAFDPNGEIRIKVSGDDEGDTNSILRRLYGKRKRP